MLKRFWSIALVTFAVLLSSSTLVYAESRSRIDQSIIDPSNLELRSYRGARLPAVPIVPSSTSEPGDDDAPNKDGGTTNPQVDDTKGFDQIRLWSFRNLGTGIRLHLLKYFSALR